MRRRAAVGLAVAALLSSAALSVQYRRSTLPHVRYDRFDLPAFDPYVYLAMAEHPRVFTVAPWGYRVLTPALARALPAGNVARGFRVVTFAALLAAALLLWALLVRLGCDPLAAAAGGVLFMASPPVAEALALRMLAEPVTVALETAFLLLLFSGAGPAPLALVAVLGTLSKEFFLLLLPLVFLVGRRRWGTARAARAMLLAALPALLATVLLRAAWTPHLPVIAPAAGALSAGVTRLGATWREWAPSTLLAGLTLLALAGALQARAQPLRLPALYLAAITLVPPFLNPVAFFAQDVPRLMVYTLPLVLPLALLAVDRVLPHWRQPDEAAMRLPPAAATACAGLAVAAALSPLLLDGYRRADLRGARDGPLVLATARETLRTAGRLQRRQPVAFAADTHRFVWGGSDPGQLRSMRWFLREGWGPLAHYGTGDMVMAADRATLLVPAAAVADLEAVLTLDAAQPSRLAVAVNGVPVAETEVGPRPQALSVRLPARALFRGDNELSLQRSQGAAPARLHSIALQAAP